MPQPKPVISTKNAKCADQQSTLDKLVLLVTDGVLSGKAFDKTKSDGTILAQLQITIPGQYNSAADRMGLSQAIGHFSNSISSVIPFIKMEKISVCPARIRNEDETESDVGVVVFEFEGQTSAANLLAALKRNERQIRALVADGIKRHQPNRPTMLH